MQTESSQNTAQLLNVASGLQSVDITINDVKIGDEYIQDIELSYDKFEIHGYFLVNDIYDLITTAFIEPEQIATITITDQYKEEYKRDFVILRSTETKQQDAKAIKFQIQDVISWKLKNTFRAKSWSSCTLVEVFNYMLSSEETDIVSLLESASISLVSTPGRTLENFCIPLNVNFLDFITDEFRKEGTYFYQTKDKIVIGDIDIPETPELPYKQTGSEETYGFVVMEYHLNFNNILETNTVLPKTKFMAYDNTKKVMEEYDKNLTDYKEDLKFSGIVKDSQVTFGKRHSTQEYLLDSTKFKHYEYYNNTQLVIYVPGNIKYSIMHKKIDVYLSGNTSADDTREAGDYKLSGKYMIMSVDDKIVIGQKFIQKLTLKRVNEEEKVSF